MEILLKQLMLPVFRVAHLMAFTTFLHHVGVPVEYHLHHQKLPVLYAETTFCKAARH